MGNICCLFKINKDVIRENKKDLEKKEEDDLFNINKEFSIYDEDYYNL